jgi:hypothetical protein
VVYVRGVAVVSGGGRIVFVVVVCGVGSAVCGGQSFLSSFFALFGSGSMSSSERLTSCTPGVGAFACGVGTVGVAVAGGSAMTVPGGVGSECLSGTSMSSRSLLVLRFGSCQRYWRVLGDGESGRRDGLRGGAVVVGRRSPAGWAWCVGSGCSVVVRGFARAGRSSTGRLRLFERWIGLWLLFATGAGVCGHCGCCCTFAGGTSGGMADGGRVFCGVPPSLLPSRA